MDEVQLYYFPLRGRAEVIKLMCAAAKAPWKLIEHSYEDQKTKLDEYYFGQCPRVVVGGLNVCQSNAIIRHLARKFDLYGKGLEEMATVDMVLDGVEDLRMKYVPLIYVDKLAPEAMAKYQAAHVDKAGATGQNNGGANFEYLERLLAKGGGAWAVPSGPTAADFALFDIVDLHARPMLFPEAMKQYPLLAAHSARVAALPGVAEYVASPLRLGRINNSDLG